ncbi:methyltransferase [Hymenobacter gummosus]|uniref:site-specific DNA-methyltransferase (adenine-specific) n=1 Tax=Hymenobacter gummosus TaxID=1776032 RepID=A0A3S0HPH5_9BACT|nr:N-6 DNA methylase [Hymenobacter gummosus]RTQ50888.1 methyltransferase [Hymenobacter gummosus]
MMSSAQKKEVVELPSAFAEKLGQQYAASVSPTHKKERGQFFTPAAIGQFMASLLDAPTKPVVRVLDPGCGVAVLACSVVEQLVATAPMVKEIHVLAFETDDAVLPYAVRALEHAKAWAANRGIVVRYEVDTADFVAEYGRLLTPKPLQFGAPEAPAIDIVLTNPPYFKLNKDDARVRLCAPVVDGQANIYALFLSIAATMLAPSGQLVCITPRSFSAGRYFRAFRRYFFGLLAPRHIHLFASRREAFERDNVLQETIIMRLERGRDEAPVTVSESAGSRDIAQRRIDRRPLREVLDRTTTEWMLYLPAGEAEKEVVQLFRGWTGSLDAYGLRISTGPVVAFRTRDYLRSDEVDAPVTALLWLHNVCAMQVRWPDPRPGKESYIQVRAETQRVLQPNRTCVLLRRFSAKDDKSRLVAAPYLAPGVVESEWVGFENKLNYLYRPTSTMPDEEAVGLAVLLNSKLFDSYFRTFNGNTNVSATELRNMPLPPLTDIHAIGREVLDNPTVDTESVITEIVGLPAIIHE